ncbi:hypothetical protein AB0912_19270 [Streptomyces sp. NPDC007084]|uniref:hypothetical protein n=1 Tax=Streptomyces sp. NPDC007084 TaxID=3154313 RepID=UPI00345292A0
MRVTRERLLAGAAVAVLLTLTGCGGGPDDKAGTARETVPATATGSLEDLAAEVKCRPDIQTDADEIRQGVCQVAGGKFILATFATDRGQRDWLNGAKDYGGSYLVGAKWVAVGDRKLVTGLRGTLGGSLEQGASHGAHASHGADASHGGHEHDG